MNIVIIGGSRGIGKAAARELLQDGHKVLIVGRNPKTLEETGKELAGAAIYPCNACRTDEVAGLVQKFLPLLAPGSRILLIGSTSGIRRDKGGIYGISKWALRSYAYNLREECKPLGIGVSLINPGGTFTETRKKSSEEDRSLLETTDLGKVIALTFRLSPQAVLEEVNIRPLQGDTY